MEGGGWEGGWRVEEGREIHESEISSKDYRICKSNSFHIIQSFVDDGFALQQTDDESNIVAEDSADSANSADLTDSADTEDSGDSADSVDSEKTCRTHGF